ncbi:MAG TPA: hypothetical protein VFQ25_07895 [Ktedonobacterales bacterium]|nr:hypothetical protein [Ktedonobacterales bacterium]
MGPIARRHVGRMVSALLAVMSLVALAGCDGSFWASSPRAPVVGPGCPAWTAGQRQPDTTPPSATDPASVAVYNAQLVTQTIRPIANPYALTERLTTRQKGQIACTATTTPEDEQVGDERSFWVINSTQNGYHRVRARLDYVTPLLYVYAQDGVGVNGLALKAAADQFETSVYAADRVAFGAQWNLGPNHDAHITLLNVTNLGPIGGYFSSGDEYPRVINPYSNERQILYLNLSGGTVPGSAIYQTTLAHEFQHMIHWWARPSDPSWVNEGMSVLAQHINGLPSGGFERAWLNAPRTPLVTGWTDDAAANQARYGAAYAFMDYLYEHYGSAAFLRAFMADGKQVPQAFDDALAHQKSHDRFNDAYARFTLAALLNDPTIAHGVYSFAAFPGQRARLTGTISTYPYASAQESLPQYGAAYYDVRPASGQSAPSTLTINIAGAPTTTIIPNTPSKGAQAEWWSNSGDNMDSTLTSVIDLTAANATPTPKPTPKATPGKTPAPTATPVPFTPRPVILTFNAWYNLEQSFDYTYVEASTDNGGHWTTLPVTTGTNANPNGKNYGHGMTGVSGGGDAPQWVPESVDLSAYAGQKILLRFETVTDDAVHQDGFALDNLSIPAIKWSDDVSTNGSWSANGWVRSNNVLPQSWIVQAVAFHPGKTAPTIQRVTINGATGAGSVTFSDFGGSVTHVELAITPVTYGSYTPAPYQLTASAV